MTIGANVGDDQIVVDSEPRPSAGVPSGNVHHRRLIAVGAIVAGLIVFVFFYCFGLSAVPGSNSRADQFWIPTFYVELLVSGIVLGALLCTPAGLLLLAIPRTRHIGISLLCLCFIGPKLVFVPAYLIGNIKGW